MTRYETGSQKGLPVLRLFSLMLFILAVGPAFALDPGSQRAVARPEGRDDTSAFSAARAAAGHHGIVEVGPGGILLKSTPRQGSPVPILWQMSGNSYVGGQAPVVAIGNDIIESFLGEQGGKFFGKGSTNPDEQGVLRVDQTVTHTGGRVGSTIPTLQTNTLVAGTGRPLNNYVWAVRHQLESKAFGPGQHVGLSSTVRRPADALADGKGPRSPIWPLYLELRDLTEKPANIAGPLVVAEWDMMGNGDDPNNQRIIHHMILQKHNPGGAAMRVGAGSVIGSNDTGPSQARSFLGVGYQVQVPVDRAAFDASPATTLPGAAAFKMREGQIIALDGDPSAGFNRGLGAAGGQLFYRVVGKDVFKISDAGQVVAQGGIVEPVGRTPATSRAPCTTGERAWDEKFEYRCVAPNRWRRAELVDW